MYLPAFAFEGAPLTLTTPALLFCFLGITVFLYQNSTDSSFKSWVVLYSSGLITSHSLPAGEPTYTF